MRTPKLLRVYQSLHLRHRTKRLMKCMKIDVRLMHIVIKGNQKHDVSLTAARG